MDFAPPDCHTTHSPPCIEANWVKCVECSQLTCTDHDNLVPIRHAGKYAANSDNVCSRCAVAMYERGELAMIRGGYQYISRR
jgi:hypothetical protein